MLKRVLSLILVLAMVCAMLPQMPIPVEAAGNEHGYVSVVEDAIEKVDDYGYGILCDVDKNGTDELIMIYQTDTPEIEAVVYSIYTLSGNTAVPLVEEEIMFYVAGAPSGSIHVIEKGEKCYIAVYDDGVYLDDSTSTWRGGETWTLYSVDGTTIYIEEVVKSTFAQDYHTGEIIYSESYCTINGTEYSYSVYEEWYSSLVQIERVNIYDDSGDWNSSGVMTMEELYSYVKMLPACSEEYSDEMPEKKKRLIQIVEWSDGELIETTHMHYNDQTGLVERISFESDSPRDDYILEYNSDGHLTRMVSGDREENYYDFEYLELTYDGDGRVTKWYEFSMPYGDTISTLNYDSQGRLAGICQYHVDGTPLSNIEFFYDNNGQLSEMAQIYDNGYSITEMYSYDANGHLVCTDRTEDGYSDRDIYRYDYFPFYTVFNDSYIAGYYDFGEIIPIEGPLGKELAAFATGSSSFWLHDISNVTTDEDGYVVSIEETFASGRKDGYEFIYEVCAATIVEPLLIDADDIELISEDRNQVTYRIYAAVENSSKISSVTNVSVVLDPGEGATITDGAQIQTTETLSMGKSNVFAWTIQIDKSYYQDGGVHHFIVMAGSNETEVAIMKGSISIEATNTQSNELDFSTDVWKFDNFSDAPCPIRDTHKSALLAGLSDSEQASIEDYLQSIGDGGHCYGMSATVILNKMNAVDLEDFTGTEKVRDATFTEFTNSIICYYHVTQTLEAPRACVQSFMRLSTADQLALLAEKADAVKSGGCPVLLSYGADGWGAHAVVAYALEPGTFTSSTTDKTYNRRILIYDCNATDFWGNVQWDPDYCLLFNEGTAEWEIPAYAKRGVISTNSNAYLKRCASAISMIDPQNYDSGLFNYYAELTSKEATKIRIEELKSGQSWNVDGSSGNIEGSTDLISYHSDGTYDSETPPDLHIVLPDEQGEYRISTISGTPEKLDFTILYDEKFVAATSSSAESMELRHSGDIVLSNNEGEFAINVTDGTISDRKFSTYFISGNSEGDISVLVTEESVTVTGDDLDGVTIKASGGEVEDEITIEGDANEVIIATEDESLNIISQVQKPKLGDVNNDGSLNAKDATMILRYVVGKLNDVPAHFEQVADVNADGTVNAKDATLILRYVVGKADIPGWER